ncbi:MAG: hypothetical protein OXC37_04265 [Bdellovibrionaceae bacterium]|nr:hypothetical protein [Pseudobdellovibrionaceae bacterium]
MKVINKKWEFYKIKLFFSKLFSFKALSLFFLIFLAGFMNFLFIIKPTKIKREVSRFYEKNFYKTLSRLEGPLNQFGLSIRVIKVKKNDKIFLEFLSKQADNSYNFINSVKLKGSREAYFDYLGETSSILLSDYDGDGFIDVMAPTFDKIFLPHFNRVIYNPKTEKFELTIMNSYPEVDSKGKRSSFFSCGFWCQ